MSMNWKKWGFDFWQSLGRHIGTAGLTWLSLGVKDGRIQWRDLYVAIIVGAVLPTVFTFLQTSPLPMDESAPPTPPQPTTPAKP